MKRPSLKNYSCFEADIGVDFTNMPTYELQNFYSEDFVYI